MDLLDYSNSIQETLLKFLAGSENQEGDVVIYNSLFAAYHITEMTKRWHERRYQEKVTGKEVTIKDAYEKSQEATRKHFRSLERRQAPQQLAETIVDASELFALLEEKKPEVKEPPADKDKDDGQESEGEKANGEVPEPREEPPEPVAAHEPSHTELTTRFGGAAAEPEGPEHYPTITPEELKEIRRRNEKDLRENLKL